MIGLTLAEGYGKINRKNVGYVNRYDFYTDFRLKECLILAENEY